MFRVLGRLPLAALYRIADIVAALAYRLSPTTRANVEDNLRHVLPDAPQSRIDSLAKRIFRNVAYYYADLAHMPRMDPQNLLDERLTLRGVHEQLVPAHERGQGTIMLSGHYGNAELVGQALVPLKIRGFALTEPIEPERLRRMMNRIRSIHGVEFMSVGVPAVKRMLKCLRDGYTVALMGDRDIHGPRMRLPFFGEETWMPTGPIEVALKTGSPVFPSFSMRRGRYGMEAVLEKPLTVPNTGDVQSDVREMALEYIAHLERYLRKEPEQWMVLERIWDGAELQPEPQREKEPATV